MGEAKRRAEAREAGPRWLPAKEARDEEWPLAVAGIVTCDCAKGAVLVVTGGRQKGEWVIECEHAIEITHFLRLPRPPVRDRH